MVIATPAWPRKGRLNHQSHHIPHCCSPGTGKSPLTWLIKLVLYKEHVFELALWKTKHKNKRQLCRKAQTEGQDKRFLQVQGVPGWQHPSIPAGTHSTVSHLRWELGNTQPPYPWKTDLNVNAQTHKPSLRGSFLRGHNYPCRACMHTRATSPCQHCHKHQCSAAKADLQAAGADSACQHGTATSW